MSYAVQLGTFILYTSDPSEAAALNELRALINGERNSYDCVLLLKSVYILRRKYVPTAVYAYVDKIVAEVIENGRCIDEPT